MKKISLLLCLFMLCFSVQITALASDSSVSATYDFEKNSIEIIGRTPNGAGVPVTIIISELEDSSLLSDDALPVATFLEYTAADGSILCKNSFSSDVLESKNYYVTIVSKAGKASCDVLVFNSNDEGTKDVLENANDFSSSAAFADYLKEDKNIEKIGFKYAEAESYIDEIADFCVNYRSSNNSDFSLTELINASKYVMFITDAKSGADTDAIMQKYVSGLEATYEQWTSLKEETKAELTELISEASYLADAEYVKFDELVLVSEARYASDSWASLKDLLLEKTDKYGIDTERGSMYDKISKSDVHNVFYAMLNDVSSAQTLEDIQKAFDEAVDEVYYDTVYNAPSSGGGGGGGGGGSKGGVIAGGSLTPTDVSTLPDNSTTAPVPETKKTFADTIGHFAEKEIAGLADIGAISGYEDGSFKPDNAVTRAEFASIICKAFGFDKANIQSEFSDVTSADWFADAVHTLASYGIVKGGDGAFRPFDAITRQDAVVIMARIAEYKSIALSDGTAELSDINTVSDYAAESVNTLCASGIIKGYNGLFRPFDSITRGETAVVISRLTELG